MMPLLSKTAYKILLVLLNQPLQEFKEIELITKAGTGKGAAAALINALVKESLLQERRLGKTKMISLHLKNSAAFWLKNLIDQEKVKRLSKVRLATALYFARKSSSTLVILFGSTIAGTATAESDVDLLVVSPDLKAVEKARKEAEELLGQQLNLHVYSKEEILYHLKNDPFIQNAVIQGVTLQGYDLASELYVTLQQEEKKSLARLHYFRERIAAVRRNYQQKDYPAAQEILERLQEQLMFYLLNEKGVAYQSKKDATTTIAKLPKGKVFNSMKKMPLKEKMEKVDAMMQTILINTILEEEGYEPALRD